MSVLVPYHLRMRPCSSRSGTVRTRNQRYFPSAPRKRISSSEGSPAAMLACHFSMTRAGRVFNIPLQRKAGIVHPTLIEEINDAVRPKAPDHGGNGVDDQPNAI